MVGSPTFASGFFNDQLSDIKTKISLLSVAITGPQTQPSLLAMLHLENPTPPWMRRPTPLRPQQPTP